MRTLTAIRRSFLAPEMGEGKIGNDELRARNFLHSSRDLRGFLHSRSRVPDRTSRGNPLPPATQASSWKRERTDIFRSSVNCSCFWHFRNQLISDWFSLGDAPPNRIKTWVKFIFWRRGKRTYGPRLLTSTQKIFFSVNTGLLFPSIDPLSLLEAILAIVVSLISFTRILSKGLYFFRLNAKTWP